MVTQSQPNSVLRKFSKRPPLAVLQLVGLLIGTLVLLILVLVGTPASLFCIGGLATWLFLRWQGYTDDLSPQNSRLLRRVWNGLINNGAELALYTAIGCAMIWLIQIGLSLFGADPESFATWQLDAFDEIRAYHWWTSSWPVLGVLGCALGVSVSLNALWPVNTSYRLCRLASNAGMVLAGVGMFSFVGVRQLADHGNDLSVITRAEIGENIQGLIEARKNHLAFQWLSASLKDPAASPALMAGLKREFSNGISTCDDASRRYAREFAGEWAGDESLDDPFCAPGRMAAAVAKLQTTEGKNGRTVESAGWLAWAPEFRTVTLPTLKRQDRPPSDLAAFASGDLGPDSSLAALRSLRSRVAAEKDQAEQAKAAARKELADGLSGVASELLKLPGLHPVLDAIIDSWRDQLIEVMVNESANQIASRLRFAKVRTSTVIGAILGIDGSALTPPPSAAAGGDAEQAEDRRLREARDEAILETQLERGVIPTDHDPEVAGREARRREELTKLALRTRAAAEEHHAEGLR